MIDKETYKRELIRMWDSVRGDEYKGKDNCNNVSCDYCILDYFCNGADGRFEYDAFEVIEEVEKWSKEHPKPKYKISQLELDVLEAQDTHVRFGFYINIRNLLSKGYFKGASNDMYIDDYLKNCEVDENDE